MKMRFAPLAAAFLVLAGCGRGGGGSTPSTMAPALAAARQACMALKPPPGTTSYIDTLRISEELQGRIVRARDEARKAAQLDPRWTDLATALSSYLVEVISGAPGAAESTVTEQCKIALA